MTSAAATESGSVPVAKVAWVANEAETLARRLPLVSRMVRSSTRFKPSVPLPAMPLMVTV